MKITVASHVLGMQQINLGIDEGGGGGGGYSIHIISWESGGMLQKFLRFLCHERPSDAI